MTDKGSALNEKVWRLFDKAGFQTRPNQSDPKEEEVYIGGGKKRTLDLSASDTSLGVKIIGWNKTKKDFSDSVSVHVNDVKELLKPSSANVAVMISTDKEFTPEDREYARQRNITLWNKEELQYYEALAAAVGPIAKYEILHSLGVSTKEQTNSFNVLAIKLRQPFTQSTPELYMFTAPPKLLLKTCVVLRRAQGSKQAYQRILQKKRLGRIAAFVRSPHALLPPNVIVYLGEEVRWEPIDLPTKDASGRSFSLSRPYDYQLGFISIPEKYASLELIDGQHRLFGFSHTDAATQEAFNIVVLGIRSIDSVTRTNTFVSINDNARRVDPNLVAYLKYNVDEVTCQANNELMAIKLAVLLNDTSPFRKKIKLLDIGDQRITLKGFAGYDLKGLLGPRGLLRKYYANTSSEYVAALRLYFGVLKSLFPAEWNDPNKYIIFTNRGISAFLKLLKSILKTEKRKLTQPRVKKYLEPLRDHWSDAHWETAELANAYVGSKGWKDFHRDLVKVIQKKYRTFVE
jgi:DNA sulfur modification protein DndB